MPSSIRQLRAQQFLLPKDGAQAAECEDAIGINLTTARCAVADGATEAFDARNWAQLLAEGWVAAESPVLTRESFSAWVAEQGHVLHEAWQGRTLSWYAEEKARRGSFAAFVGVQFEIVEDAIHWTALALGDACLIQQRNGAICHALPIADHQLFTTTPVLVPSRGQLHETAFAPTRVEQGTFEPTDVIWLLSDATAEWFLKRAREHDPILDHFDNLLVADQAAEIAALFAQERRARRIKDDDIAIVRVTLTAG